MSGGGAKEDNSHLHIDMDLVDIQPSAEVPPLWPLQRSRHTHQQRAEPSRGARQASVTHLLRQLVGVKDSGHGHLQLVLLLLSLA